VTNEEGVIRDEPMFLAFAALGRYCGGGMLVAPDASPGDGLFDVVTVGDVGKLELLVNLRRLFDGTLTGYHKVSVARTAQLRVESDPPSRVQADGELLGATPVTFSVLPGAASVIVP
jgi:diacylglycerol kinase (ATP)